MTIKMTDFAVEKVSSMMIKSGFETSDSFLKIGLRGGGCSGYTYDFSFSRDHDESDKIFTFGKLSVCIDKKSYLFLVGTEIDYEETVFKSGIKINNPAATRVCGCGESVAF